jgi:hypothetical protein
MLGIGGAIAGQDDVERSWIPRIVGVFEVGANCLRIWAAISICIVDRLDGLYRHAQALILT